MFLRQTLALPIVVLVVALSAAAAAAQPLSGQGAACASLACQVLNELNSQRAARGLHPLRLAPALSAAATQHSREMSRAGYFDHRSADGSAFWKRVARFYPAGGFRVWSVGENLLWSSPEIGAAGAVRMWKESPAHRKIMFDPAWREVGINALHVTAAPGFYMGLDVTLVTVDFGVRT